MTRFYKVLVNIQFIRENPPFFGVYYIKGHKNEGSWIFSGCNPPRVGRK